MAERNAQRAAENEALTGLGRELEKLVIDALAVAALGRIRARACATGAHRMTHATLWAVVNATRTR